MIVGVPFILEGQSPVANVIQVLEPLEVRHGHSASVQEQVWYDQDLVVTQRLIRFDSRRPVRSLTDDLGLYSVRVVPGYDLLDGARQQYVALLKE